MIKYAKGDIITGINSLKIGIGNIIASVAKEEISHFKLDIPLDYQVVVFSLRQLFPESHLQYADNYILVKFDDKIVCITFDKVIYFNLWEIKRDSVLRQ